MSSTSEPLALPARADTGRSDTGLMRIEGKNFVAPDGRTLQLKGISLGNWLMPEGYMFKFEVAKAPRQIYGAFDRLLGAERAAAFWRLTLAGILPHHALDTLLRLGAGFALAALAGVAIGLATGRSRRAEDVMLEGSSRDAVSARNRLTGRVTDIQSECGVVRVSVDCGFPLSALITKPALQELGLGVDSTVTAAFKATAVHLIPRES